jgi:hypothetical protein
VASRITERIERELGMPGLCDALAERLDGSDLQSLLLEVFRRRAGRKRDRALLAEHQENRFAAPCRVSPLELLEWDRLAFANLPPGCVALELSPVAVLGACAAVAPVSQDRVISTARNSEVASDPTNVLALEAALRRRELLRADVHSSAVVHLAASQRVVRAQKFGDPALLPHFRLFALCSAGRDTGAFGFEKEALALHVAFYLSCLRAHLGPSPRLRVALVVDAALRESLGELEAGIRARFGDVECGFTDPPEAHSYYRGFRFQIAACPAGGRELELVDGGAVDWTSRLLSNAKERLLISGIGSERVCALLPHAHGA